MDIAAVKSLVKEGDHGRAIEAILESAQATKDYAEYVSLCRLRQKIDSSCRSANLVRDLRIAVLGGATTDFLEQPIKLELETLGLGTQLFIGGYDSYAHEMLRPDSQASIFRPDVTLLLLTPFNIVDWPAVGDGPEQVDALVEKVCEHWLGLCEAFHGHSNSEIIVGNMHLLPTRATGNLGARLPWDKNNFLRQVNVGLSKRAPSYVHIFDIDTLSSLYGIDNWFDPRFWFHSKQPVSFACVVPYVRSLASIVGALYGRTAKCLILDLDNTLWGGVVGDDGIEGLKIGEGDAEGEAFKAFQEYLLSIKERGILLAVCSKNDEANAVEPFNQLPEMVLKRQDFVSFRANWDPKPGNIEEIARQLNIGLDALVFVDDNPAEREHVRQALPQVRVVELSEDPAEYPRLLEQTGWLEIARFTDEDRDKTGQYVENLMRTEARAKHTDYESYLESLNQKAAVSKFESKHLERITQLINKTNQFNLTTQRLNRSEVQALMDDAHTLTVSVRLVDRFGDNGLISVLSGHRDNGVLYIDLWLMSCRVFNRGVERLVANHVFEMAARNGIGAVQGTFIPSPKNGIVENLYSDLGFEHVEDLESCGSVWKLDTKDYAPSPVHISLMQDVEE